MTAAVVFDQVSFSYPDSTSRVLADASLEIHAGAFVLVTGTTGSGKSTLLRAINGLVPHFTGGSFSGRVVVHGRDTLQHAPRELADVVAFVPQDPGSSFVLDRVEDELAYAMENLGLRREVMRRRVEETLDLLDIEPLRDRSVRAISGGERQRVAIAAALTPSPHVLVLDEPTSQLDPQGAEDVLSALQRIVHDLGLTVVIAEHRLERVAGFVDVAIRCARGTAPETGSPAEVIARSDGGPPVTRLGRLVGWHPPPLTVREARRRAAALELPADPPARERGPGDDGALVAARNLTARYGERAALRRVTLELRRGEVVALMGRNGAGKTTLLRCLAGLHAPSAGEVIVDGRAPSPGKDVALCPQTPEALLFAERVVDEVRATLDATRRGGDARGLLDDFGIARLADRHPRDVSAGERLLVATAAVAASAAPVLLLDEPTRGLDPQAKARLAHLLRVYVEAGRAAVVATHDVELAAEVATRVVLLARGEVIADGPPSDVLGDSSLFAPQMARVFGPGWLTPEQVAAAALSP